MDLKSTYNRIAADWFKDHNADTWWQEGTNHFLSLLSKGATILDIGCGPGVTTRYLSDKGFRVTGMDFSEKMIEIAHREVPNIEFLVGDIYELDSFNRTFDAIFAKAVLLHVPKDKVVSVLEKMRDKLNPGGLLYIAVKENTKIDGEIVKENDYGYEYERFFSYFTLPEVTAYLEKIGMKVVLGNIANSGKTNWIQVISQR